jgi:hypothetical protein
VASEVVAVPEAVWEIILLDRTLGVRRFEVVLLFVFCRGWLCVELDRVTRLVERYRPSLAPRSRARLTAFTI